jgi:hypothetical protein
MIQIISPPACLRWTYRKCRGCSTGVLVAKERQRQQLVRVFQAPEPLDRDEPVDASQVRAHRGGDIEVFLATGCGFGL